MRRQTQLIAALCLLALRLAAAQIAVNNPHTGLAAKLLYSNQRRLSFDGSAGSSTEQHSRQLGTGTQAAGEVRRLSQQYVGVSSGLSAMLSSMSAAAAAPSGRGLSTLSHVHTDQIVNAADTDDRRNLGYTTISPGLSAMLSSISPGRRREMLSFLLRDWGLNAADVQEDGRRKLDDQYTAVSPGLSAKLSSISPGRRREILSYLLRGRLLQQTKQESCHLGCYADAHNKRALRRFLYLSDQNMTLEDCQAAAERRNLTLFAVQNGRECWGGRNLNRATLLGSDAKCNQTCTGNRSQTCGGWLAFNLYSVGDCPGNFSTSAVVYPAGNVSLGQDVHIRVNVTSTLGNLTDGVVDVEVYDRRGNRVFQKYAKGQNFTAGQRRTYEFRWTPHVIPEGFYAVKLGVFTDDWSLLHWNDPAAIVPVSAKCQVQVAYGMFWNFDQWQTTFMNIFITNWREGNITNPWDFTLYNPTYTGNFLAWNLQPVSYSVENHTYDGTAAPWQGDLPSGTPVYFRNFNVISSDSLDFLPTVFTINGEECSVSRVVVK